MRFRIPKLGSILEVLSWLWLLQIIDFASAYRENEVMAEPHIMCNDGSIGLQVQTKNPYFGRMFVNGMSDFSDCVTQTNSVDHAGRFEIPFGTCDMRVKRILHPRPGVEYSTTMIVSFHDELLTMTDRAFHIKCNYYQQEKSFGSYFEVSMLPTVMLTSDFPMPNCQYTLHVQAVNGPAAQFARIGDQVFHRWTCDSALYGIKIKSCFVDDGQRKRYQLIDNAGCASDHVILPDVTYDPTLNSAYVQTHVFKFADKAHVFFQCQISLCLKSAGACEGVTPPNCDPRYRYDFGTRRKRSFNVENASLTTDNMLTTPTLDQLAEMDVVSPSLVVLDLGDERKFESYVKTHPFVHKCDVCLPKFGFGGLIAVNLITLCFATSAVFALCRQRPRKRLECIPHSRKMVV